MSNRPKTSNMVAVQQAVLSHSGPLPAAAEFERYERALPGTAEKIVSLAEKETDYRHRIDEKMVDGSLRLEGRGQTLATVVILAAIVAAVGMAALGQPAASIAPALIAAIGVGSVFIRKNR